MNTDKKTDMILSELESNGFEAYMVGGCVRDEIMGRKCHDTDITTNALPEQILKVFSGYKVIPTGLKHGTVTVLCEDTPFEITTYRIDGEYTDHRRPDKVDFTSDITADLSRRDFTVNAIAMDRHGNIVDPFGGKDDITAGIIRCVGDPEKRFNEDALRIMRAVRFASQLGFSIDKATSDAIHSMRGDLKKISRERIREELDKLVCGNNCVEVLLEYSDVITAIIPEFEPSIGLDQRSPYHRYNVWEHTVRAIAAAPSDDLLLRRALLFHDIGKPACMTIDETGRGHFKKHDSVGSDMTAEIMRELRYDSRTISDTSALIANHSKKIRSKADVKRMMNHIGDELFFELMVLKKCDNSAKNEFVLKENFYFDKLIETGKKIIENNECRNIRGLAINGSDIVQIGLKGAEIGEVQQELLELVIGDILDNNKDELIKYAEQRCRK